MLNHLIMFKNAHRFKNVYGESFYGDKFTYDCFIELYRNGAKCCGACKHFIHDKFNVGGIGECGLMWVRSATAVHPCRAFSESESIDRVISREKLEEYYGLK